MKKLTLTLALALAAASAAAQHQMGGTMDTMKQPASAAAHRTSGVVKQLDRDRGTVTIAHEAVASLKWPAMTMRFAIQDKALFDKLGVGQKIDFEFIQGSKGYVVTAVK